MRDLIEQYLKSEGHKCVRPESKIKELHEEECIVVAEESVGSKAEVVIVYDGSEKVAKKEGAEVYRLVSKGTVEEKIFEINRSGDSSLMKDNTMTLQVVDGILKHGVEAIFKESEEKKIYTPEIIKQLLDRSKTIEERADLLKGLSKTQHSAEEVKDNAENYWYALLKEHVGMTKIQNAWGKRKHSEVQINSEDSKNASPQKNVMEETKNPAASNKRSAKVAQRRKQTCNSLWSALDPQSFMAPEFRARQLTQASNIAQQLINNELSVYPVTFHNGKLVCTMQSQSLLESYQLDFSDSIDLRTSLSIVLWGFHELNRRDFMDGFMKYGVWEHNWKELYDRCVAEESSSIRRRTVEEFVNYAQKFSTIVNEFVQKQRYGVRTFFTGPYSVKQIIVRVHHISLLRGAHRLCSGDPARFAIDTKEYRELTSGKWKNTDDFELIRGVLTHGYGSLHKIITDPHLWAQQSSPSSHQPWKIIFNKVSGEQYESESEEPDTQFVMQNYVVNYLKLRLKFVVGELEKTSAKSAS
eukprot:TRINITY_DN12518_c0_g1_i9.p1 TRINITY_DN12518_c0_g1~~TRINITY_DN12518_c0_g1_i9.p1  ORF type:complete len:526 (+),score=167.23 TRINITY_DN12518_c0_g1_i9:121-1698(+)